MSIINDTLNRLEMDSPIPAGNPGRSGSPPPAVKPMGLPLKLLATAMLVVFAGTSLVVWYGQAHMAGSTGVSPAAVSSQTVPAAKSDHQQSPVSAGQPVPPEPQLAVQQQEGVAMDAQSAVPQDARPADRVSEAVVEPMPASDAAPQPRPSDKPVVAVKAKPVATKAKTAKSEPERAVSRKRQQKASVAQTAQPSPVDTAVERARLALSQGRYQQALLALDALSRAPEHRADFWLMKGSAHLALGQLESAEKAFALAHPLAPGNAQIAVQLAILKQEKGDHTSALKILESAASTHPDVPEVFLNLGYSQQELGAQGDAGRSFRTFLRMTEGRSLYAEQRKVVDAWLSQLPTAVN